MVFDGEIGYCFWVEYLDYMICVVGIVVCYNVLGMVSLLMVCLFFLGVVLDVDQIMLCLFNQFGMLFGFGMDYLDCYMCVWWFFMDVGMLYDNCEGWGVQVQFGVVGSVFGNDYLVLYIEY